MNSEEKAIRMNECIYDITVELPAMMKQEWFSDDIDSRVVFFQVRECAEFYEDTYPEDDDEYLTNISDLAWAWFRNFFGEAQTPRDDLMLCSNQRVAQFIRDHEREGYSLYDYDCWINIEDIVGEEITADEYHKINSAFDDDLLEYGQEDAPAFKKVLENIRRVKTYKIIKVRNVRQVFETQVKANSEVEARVVFDALDEQDEFEEEWADAVDYAEVLSEETTVREVDEDD